MEINLGNSFGGNVGMRTEAQDVNVERVRCETVDAPQDSRQTTNLTIGEKIGLSSVEPAIDVPADELERDDPLGKLVNAAFNLPPPPMPAFVAGQ